MATLAASAARGAAAPPHASSVPSSTAPARSPGGNDRGPDVRPGKVLIAHRGSSGAAPENTLEAYRLALQQGADYVEQDLQVTKDGVLVCCHDLTLERTTDVEQVFPDRFTVELVKDKPVKHWFIYDFTLAELKQLDAGAFLGASFRGARIPTWQEAIDVIHGKAGLCPETKGPQTVYGRLGVTMEKLVVETLKRNGLDRPARGKDSTPVLFQSFSDTSLKRLAQGLEGRWPMIQLRFVGAALKPGELEEIARYATGVGPFKRDVTPALAEEAHRLGLNVIPYTFRTGDEKGFATVAAEMRHYLYDLGVDGLFTDNPAQFPRGDAEPGAGGAATTTRGALPERE